MYHFKTKLQNFKQNIAFFRLHENSERKCLNPKSDSLTIKRRRGRHRLRKVLLALDYLVECLGGCIIFIAIFIGDESLLQQHILLTIGSFIYGVPIPLAYLLNETRVRNIIIKKGWLEGFISIFHSPEKIKALEQERIVNYLHPNISSNNDMYISQKIDKYHEVTHKIEHENRLCHKTENCQSNWHVINRSFLQKDQDNERVSKSRGTKIMENCYDSSDEIRVDLSYRRDVSSLNCKNNKLLMCSDTSFIQSFFEQSDKVIDLLCDDNFKIFSRKYILNTILKLLKTNAKETDYKKYFGHLCCLESYPEEQKDSESKLNFIISLMNAWFLMKNKSYLLEIHEPLAKDCENQRIRKNAANYQHEKRNAREQIIKNLIKNVSCDTQYIQHLKLLYDLEDEEDEEESVYGW